MRCKWNNKPCDPESYYCHYLDRTFERSLNTTCDNLIVTEEAEG